MQTAVPELSTMPETGMLLGASLNGVEIFGDVFRGDPDLSTLPLDPSLVDPVLHPEVFRMRLAGPRAVQGDAGQLVRQRYESRGYQAAQTVTDPNLYTFAAYSAGKLVGTLGVRLDSPEGLKIEELYGDEVDSLRARGLGLSEFTRLAVAESAASKEVLGALFHTAVLFSHVVRGCSNVVIEVNPRHVAYYRRVLFFKPLGPQRHLDRIGAPAVALVLEFPTLMQAIGEFFSKPDWRDRTGSVFSTWFSPTESDGIVNRLRRLNVAREVCRAPASNSPRFELPKAFAGLGAERRSLPPSERCPGQLVFANQASCPRARRVPQVPAVLICGHP
jgi:hypothetical protein